MKTRIITDEKTGKRFMLAFDRDGILYAFVPIESTSPLHPLPQPTP